ncbi:alpha/beta hydrolase [Nocardioides mangrovi]|uniref:Alpha/beta hydrolase n=1 Tax=Nocardioides mangrovi TaxID=2874580 RepID=A0ABS7UK37_9ACTN|nr:alpha/beta hydrolase [Nocardioides mangrovi]MBZ5741224.1 alpha/beta hydrolase [Nocardioides mangrovi]
MRALVLVLVLLVGASTGCAGAETGDTSRAASATVTYAPGLAATVYLPEGERRVPVVVMVPGGGWATADPSGLIGLAGYLADHGVAAATVHVRSAEDGVTYPTPVGDVLCAVAGVVDEVRSRGVRPTTVAVLGHSSGAHLAALAVLTGDERSGTCGAPAVRPDALIGLSGPYDIAQVPDLAVTLLGSTPEEDPAAWTAANPVRQAARRPAVPVLLLHGRDDDLVPPSFTEGFAAALEAGGHRTTVRMVTGADHDTIYAAEVAGPPVVEWLASLAQARARPAAAPAHLDPAALPRGADPGVARLVRDTLRDGDRRLAATARGRHDALWTVAGGYLLRDYDVGRHHQVRVVFLGRDGKLRTVARSRAWIDVAVSPDGRRVAIRRIAGRAGQRSLLSVEIPRSGRVLAEHELRLATLVAVTGGRVLLARRLHGHHPVTQWWNLERDSLRTVAHQAAIRADTRRGHVVLSTSSVNDACVRVAPIAAPGRTSWRSCTAGPYAWSPDGTHAAATRTYFDAAGTDRWWVVDGHDGARQARITGRLDWHAVWEDDDHVLTLAQGDSGGAAVVRCDLTGACERASRTWPTPLPTEPSLYYRSPPVVLADR